MYSVFMLTIASFVLALILTPLCRDLAIRWRLLDRPDEIRKFHLRAVPRVGGIPIFIAYLASFAILLFAPFQVGNSIREHLDVVRKLFPAATIIFFTGLVDDLLGLKAWQKFAAQLAAAAVAISAGVQITILDWRHLPPWCAISVTALWLVGCTNAFNLIDGVDGLAAGVGLFATVTTLIAALLEHNIGLAVATVPLAGALLGILRYNFNPASIFLGDSGSLFIGFLLGCYSVLWSQKSATIVGMTAPLIALSIPILDTCLSVMRRFLRGQPIFDADHGHIHHKLLGRGLTPRRVVILVYIICGLCAALSLLQNFAHERLGGLIIVLFCSGVLIGVQYLGYSEFEMARRLVLAGNFRRTLNAELQLSKFREDLAVAATPEQCWKVLQRTYSEFGFNEIRFKVADRLYTDTTNSHHDGNVWTVRIRLSENDYINFSREFNTEAPPIVGRYTDAIGNMLRTKAFEMTRTNPIYADISIDVSRVQPASGLSKPLLVLHKNS
jgi:UDP-GlcNAc:undecaprenyl-phosphate GlcNAc-1-phosphate transferase